MIMKNFLVFLTSLSHLNVHSRFLQRTYSCDVKCTNADELVKYMKEKPVKRIIVMAGAGISTPSGIPDFR